jgi:hypothetical protein
MYKIVKIAIGVLFFLTSIMGIEAQTPSKGKEINNGILSVQWDDMKSTFSITHLHSKKVFVKDLLPKSVSGKGISSKTQHPVFGTGKTISLPLVNGTMYFTLYPTQPFVFIHQSIKNTSDDTINVKQLHPLSFFVDLNRPAIGLKTLGTGGLLAPDKNPGSYVFLTTVDPTTRNGVVTGWLTHEKGSGVLFSSVKHDAVEIRSQIDYGHYHLPPGKTGMSETLVVGYFDDARIGEELFADALAQQHQIKLRDRSATYCTWYAEKNGGAGTESSSIELADFARKNLKKYGFGVIQIDDQWQDGGSYNGPTRAFDRVRLTPLEKRTENGKTYPGYPANYKNGMEPVAKAIKDAGLSAGIWWMPFARNHQDPEYASRQHWFARRTDGQPYETPWGGTSLDLTHPEVKNHVEYITKKLMGWGYDYFKMDGLWTGTVTEQIYINDGYKDDNMGNCQRLYDPLCTQIEAFRNGLKLINKTTQGKVFLSGCCISQNMRSFGPSIGLVHSMRIGPDYSHEDGIKTGPIRASRLYFLNGRVWWNDPDPAVIREAGIAGGDPSSKGVGDIERSRMLPTFAAVSGQFYLSSDWIPDLPAERLEIMKRTMASHTGIARPVDAFDQFLPSIWLASDKKSGIERNILGIFNWDTTATTISCSLQKAGLKSNAYYGYDFWADRPIDNISQIAEKMPKESCRVIALRAKTSHPVIVSTSQHVTQGMIDMMKERWENGTLSATSKLIAGDVYEVRIAGVGEATGWKFEGVSLTDKSDKSTKIFISPKVENGWLRIIIQSNESKTVNWKIKFIKK